MTDRYSAYSHPFQLTGQLFKTRSYKTEEAMNEAAAKVLAESKHPVPGYPILHGYRHMMPEGLQQGWYMIHTYYPAPVPLVPEHQRPRLGAPPREICPESGYRHRPDDDPGPGHHCKDCGRVIVWLGPNQYDWEAAS